MHELSLGQLLKRLTALLILSGTPISVLDGVLVAIKDEIDCMPYPTTGTI